MTGTNKFAIAAVFMGLIVLSSLFGFGNREVPDASIETSGTQYLSPNDDGIQDDATIEFEVTVYVKSEEGYVPEYGISLTDESGAIIRQVVEKEQSDVGWFLRIFRSFQSFTLNKTLSWDGTDTDGNLVADGTYVAKMWVIAASNQRSDFDIDNFVVDTLDPSATIEEPDLLIFSPNGDNNFDALAISQSNGTNEDLWEAGFINSGGQTVRSFSWRDGAPDSITWDGTEDTGSLAADGVYRYAISATDRAGNSVSYAIENIELDTTDTPLTVTLDQSHISPNGDKVQDTLTIDLSQEVTTDILSWSLVVDDGAGTVIRQYAQKGDPPVQIVFDGKNDAGQAAAEGSFRALYTLEYRNGNKPFTAKPFVIDLTKPIVSVAVSEPFFSPNGDGRKDSTSITFKSNEKVAWTGNVSDSSGANVLSTDSSQTTSLVVFRGYNLDGSALADGEYSGHATFTDLAGNSYSPPPETVVIDRVPPKVSFSMDLEYFSPDGDGVKDTVVASFTSSEPVKGLLTITDKMGQDFGTLGGFGRAYQYVDGVFDYVWNGITGSGLYIPDGVYGVGSTYEDRAGNRTDVASLQLAVDTRPIRIATEVPSGFSPNGDGVSDSLDVQIVAGFYDSVETWSMSFLDASGKVLQVKEGEDNLPKQVTWDGSMQFADVAAPEGRYTAELETIFKKGDRVSISSSPFFIDVTPPAVNIQATADPFEKTADQMEGDLYITLQIDDAHEVTDWELDVLTPESEIVRSFTGTGDLADQVIWKGEPERVKALPISDQVVLRVEVMDEVGNSTVFERPVSLEMLVVRRDNKLYLLVPNVIFDAYRHALNSRGPEMYRQNLASINRVAEIFNRYTSYNLLLEGHALNVFRGDAEKAKEEEEVLVPLTERRAKTVRDALVNAGLQANRIETAWFGGTLPIVDVHDKEIRWKNRRVEFIMLEKSQD